jgi:hypothetical protein
MVYSQYSNSLWAEQSGVELLNPLPSPYYQNTRETGKWPPKGGGVAQATICTRISGQTSPKESRLVGVHINVTNILFTQTIYKYKVTAAYTAIVIEQTVK